MIVYDSVTVSYAWELISVTMSYSQGGGFNTSLSRVCAVPASHLLACLHLLTCAVYGVRSVLVVCVLYCVGYSCRWHGHVLPGTTLIKVMCVHQLYQQG